MRGVVNPLVPKRYNSTGVPVGRRFYLWHKRVHSGTMGLRNKIYICIKVKMAAIWPNKRVMACRILKLTLVTDRYKINGLL